MCKKSKSNHPVFFLRIEIHPIFPVIPDQLCQLSPTFSLPGNRISASLGGVIGTVGTSLFPARALWENPPGKRKQMVVPVPSEVVQGEEAVETTPMYNPEDERLKHDFLEAWFGSFSFLNGCIRRFHVNLPGCNLT